MHPSEILRVCMNCKQVAQGGTDDWREATDADETHPARSHGYCATCFEQLYPEAASENDSKRKPPKTQFEKGMHLVCDREHYKTLPKAKRWLELVAYRSEVRKGINPITAAARVIMAEFAS